MPQSSPLIFGRSAVTQLLCGMLVAAGLVSTGCRSRESASGKPFDLTRATYVGRDACTKCHAEQAKLFSGSHHDLAMQPATDETVLANFDDQTIVHHDVESRLFRQGKRFMVHTEGPDGEMADFEIKYVFGVEPLQQFMVEMPAVDTKSVDGALPRIQVLRLSWDTVGKEWFYLPPPDVDEKLEPDDDLHWTGIAQRWNTMCAECHSTDFRKGFTIPASHAGLVESDRSPDRGSYTSMFEEIDVSCEACHGPASVHLELAQQWFPGWNRKRGYGLADLKQTAENQIQACAPCHSRRSVIASGFKAGDNFYDHFASSLLQETIYYPDGQILDEDYVHGSFIQSKMYHKGIRCSDCHDPHSVTLKHSGNQVCTSCHQHPAAKYDSVAHHFHKPGGEGAQCVNCHMPATTYMEVDARRDHSLRIPRPDISLKIGTPNACTGCHLEPENLAPDKRDQLPLYQDWMLAAREGDAEVQAELERANRWCDEACDRWYGDKRRRDDHFGLAIAAAQNGDADAVPKLRNLLGKVGFEAPAIARASALEELAGIAPEVAAEEAARLIKDSHPTVRLAAAAALTSASEPARSISLLEEALTDPIRSVRTEAARNLLYLPKNLWSNGASADLRAALEELTDGLQYSNDRPGAHMTLGILAEMQGRDQQAIKHYQDAVRVGPKVTGARTNLAALLERNLQSQAAATGKANEALQAEVMRLREEELELLKRDAGLLPDNASIQSRLGLALYIAERPEEAIDHLVSAAELEPQSAYYAQCVTLLYEKMGKWDEALRWAEEGVRRSGGAAQYVNHLRQIRAAAQQGQ